MKTVLRHGKLTLALHQLRSGSGRALLRLHGLGERSPRAPSAELADWPGPIFALDFTGHGESAIPVGGGYVPELLLADADTALAHLGAATVIGYGIGAYAALMLCGIRSKAVRGAILCDGPGLAGGGSEPGPPTPARSPLSRPGPPDPFALLELENDVRPPEFAERFATMAIQGSGLERPISLCAASLGRARAVDASEGEPGERDWPAWLTAVRASAAAGEASVSDALAFYRDLP